MTLRDSPGEIFSGISTAMCEFIGAGCKRPYLTHSSKSQGLVRKGRILSEAAVCSYPRGTKDERWWLPCLRYLWRARVGGELAEGQHWPGTNITGLFGGKFLNRDVQDSLLVCHGPHIVLSSVLDLSVRDTAVENE